jgi:hypothetical protein
MKRRLEDLHDEPRRGRLPAADLTCKIQEVLNHNPFESARSIAEILQVSHSSVPKHLHVDLEFWCFHLRWVPPADTRIEGAKAPVRA